MKQGFERTLVLAGLVVTLVFTAPYLCAQPVTLDWFVIAGGGSMSSGSSDSLTAIIGLLAPEMTSGGNFTFLGGLSAVSQRILCPANFTVNTDPGQCTRNSVTYDVAILDSGPGASVSCSPPSGSAFAQGVTTVICTATDAGGAINTCSFTVTVMDTMAPTMTCPPDQIRECASAAGATVNYTVSATDVCDPNPLVGCVPPSGSTFPWGSTLVNCTATDGGGNRSSCSFTVTVVDTTPPTIICRPNQTVECACPSAAPVNYAAPRITDNCDLNVSYVCTPPAGTLFPLGSTQVNCAATDRSGNVSSCSFTVTVRDTSVGIQPPRITDITLMPDGQVRIQYTANPNSQYALFSGEEMTRICSALQSTMAPSSMGEFIEPFRPTGATFYRVAEVPSVAIPITFCPTNITAPGQYVLAVDCAVPPDITALGINANNVYLNLNSHTISGPISTAAEARLAPTTAGIAVSGGNVHIYNGTVHGFSQGILLQRVSGVFGSHDNYLAGLTVTSNRYGILLVDHAVNNHIGCNNVSGNFEIGVLIGYGSDQNEFNSNVVTNNGGITGGAGLFIVSSGGNVITNNNISGNPQNAGVWVYTDSHRNIIQGNMVNGNSDGIRINVGSGGNILRNNTARGNRGRDFLDYNLPASCTNTWMNNTFVIDNEGDGPGAGCIR